MLSSAVAGAGCSVDVVSSVVSGSVDGRGVVVGARVIVTIVVTAVCGDDVAVSDGDEPQAVSDPSATAATTTVARRTFMTTPR
ncbi:hypothetical protein GCM10009773_09030 [Williamsia serinedens]